MLTIKAVTLTIFACLVAQSITKSIIVPCKGWEARNAQYIDLTGYQFVPAVPKAGTEFKIVVKQTPKRNYYVPEIRGVVYYVNFNNREVAEIDEEVNQEFRKGVPAQTTRSFNIALALPGKYNAKIYSEDQTGKEIICLSAQFEFK